MANTGIGTTDTPGGQPVAVNPCSDGLDYQVIKLDVGGDGTAQLADASHPVPVSLPSSQITAITPPAAITNYANESGGHLAALDANAGTTADAAVITDANGTLSAKLRGLVKLLASVISGGLLQTRALTSADQVTVAALPAIPAGTNVIGHVVVDTAPTTAVTGPLTDTQLRATAVPVSVASVPLPTGAATEATLAGVLTQSDFDTKAGSLTETAPTTDTASSGLNGRLQRIAQRITSLIAAFPSALTGGGNFKVSLQESNASQAVTGTFWQATQPVSAASLPLPSGAATETTLGAVLTQSDFDSKAGSLTETAPATDTASSGLNGRLQRIAQRLTSLIGLLPTALTGSGNLKVAVVESTASVSVTLPRSSTASSPAQTAVSSTNSQILAGNASRKKLIIQNTGTVAIKLVLGSTAATQTAYTICLGAAGAADAGDGGSFVDEVWTGAVQAISASAATCVVTELT